MPEKQMVGRAGFEQSSPANTLREGAGVTSGFELKRLFRACPAPSTSAEARS
jgi:hypothetical protein